MAGSFLAFLAVSEESERNSAEYLGPGGPHSACSTRWGFERATVTKRGLISACAPLGLVGALAAT